MAGIPISSLVRVTPSVLAPAPGVGPLKSVIFSQSTLLQFYRIQTFTSLTTVGNFFGGSSVEYQQAEVFFSGFTGATNLPSQLTFVFVGSQSAVLVSAPLTSMTLTQLQAVNATMTVTGQAGPATFGVSFAGVASFAAAGTILNTGASGVSGAALLGGYDPASGCFWIQGAVSPGFGTGALATALSFTQALGAQSFPAITPSGVAAFMNDYANRISFSGFTTAYEPAANDLTSFAVWTAAQNNTVMACLWDTSTGALTANNASSFGATVMAQAYSGVVPVYLDPLSATLPLAVMSSLNFATPNGRWSIAYRSNSLVGPTVSDGNTATTLLGNGYNFYGAYAGEGLNYLFFYDGHIAGPFRWIDSFICQIAFNASLENALVALLMAVGQIPFNYQGDALIEAAIGDPIANALSFGTIRQGVTLSQSQAAEVNAAAGKQIDGVLSSRGWYVIPGASTAPPSTRVARGPIVTQVYYCDGQSVQTVSVSSVDVL